jgi:hypothetical protein
MDNYHPQASMHVKAGHEETDFSLRGIILFIIILILSAIVTLIVAWALLRVFEWTETTYFEKKPTPVQKQLSDQRGGETLKKPGAVKPAPDWYSRAVDERTIERTFAAPRLQYDDTADMDLFLKTETDRLHSVGKDSEGNIYIPIDRAIDLVASEGLPPVNGTFVPGPPLGNLQAVADAAQKRLQQANVQAQQPTNRRK